MKKNLMLCVVILSISVGAHAGSILPDRIVTPLLDLFSNRNRETLEGKMEVMVTTFESQKMKPRDRKAKDAGGNEYDDDYKITDSAGELTRNGDRIVLGADQYQQFKKLASAVYRMIPHSYSSGGMSGPSEIIYVGTAFHIGNNLVLTNVHVLSHSFDNLTECGRFELKEAASQTTYTCKKVHFCSKEHDICLIEMNTNKKTFCRGNDCETTSLARGESLKISMEFRDPKLHYQDGQIQFSSENTVLTAIGNTKGFGIHLSQGKGFDSTEDILRFYAPIRGGNSGGPLLNDKGLVVGVVKEESGRKVGTNTEFTYNVATTSKKVILLIREALANDPVTLEKFNRSVVE